MYSTGVNKEDLPPAYNIHDVNEILFVPFLRSSDVSSPRQKGRRNDIPIGVFRFVSTEKGILDEFMKDALVEIIGLLQYICDRGNKLDYKNYACVCAVIPNLQYYSH